jgi:archaellum component FlaF (FlaF/FlaG flagellin family)
MKKTIFFIAFLICFVQLLTAHQTGKVQVPSALEILTKHPWVTTNDQFGTVQLEFIKDLTFTVTLKSNNVTITGTFSLKGESLTFETDSSCQEKGEYTIKVTEEVLNLIKKEDQCNGRNEIAPGIWKVLKQ